MNAYVGVGWFCGAMVLAMRALALIRLLMVVLVKLMGRGKGGSEQSPVHCVERRVRPRRCPRKSTTKAMIWRWSFWPIRAKCADVVAIHYIGAKTPAGSAQLGLFRLLLCNQAASRRIYQTLNGRPAPAVAGPSGTSALCYTAFFAPARGRAGSSAYNPDPTYSAE